MCFFCVLECAWTFRTRYYENETMEKHRWVDQVTWGPVSIGIYRSKLLSSFVIPGRLRSSETADCCNGIGSVLAAAVVRCGVAVWYRRTPATLWQAELLVTMCSDGAGENTPHHTFPPLSSGFFDNLFGNIRFRMPWALNIKSPLRHDTLPSYVSVRDRSKCC